MQKSLHFQGGFFRIFAKLSQTTMRALRPCAWSLFGRLLFEFHGVTDGQLGKRYALRALIRGRRRYSLSCPPFLQE